MPEGEKIHSARVVDNDDIDYDLLEELGRKVSHGHVYDVYERDIPGPTRGDRIQVGNTTGILNQSAVKVDENEVFFEEKPDPDDLPDGCGGLYESNPMQLRDRGEGWITYCTGSALE